MGNQCFDRVTPNTFSPRLVSSTFFFSLQSIKGALCSVVKNIDTQSFNIYSINEVIIKLRNIYVNKLNKQAVLR